MNRITALAALVMLHCAPCLAATASAPLIRIGAAAVVRGQVKAASSLEGSVGRVVGSGQPLYLNDKVSTDANGRLQILLLDETVFTVGPNTTIILDKFVYDPSSGAGEVSANVVKGVFRFVTGKVAKTNPGSMKVRTPVGTIGIHGTDVVGIVGPDRTTILLKSGAISVTNEAGSVEIDRADYATTIGVGMAPSPAFAAPQSLLEALGGGLAPPQFGASPGSGQPVFAAQPPAFGDASLAGLDSISQFISQKAAGSALFPNGETSSWSDVRAVLLGNGVYAGGGAAFNGGAPCAGGAVMCTGAWNYTLNADFNARTITVDATILTPNIVDITNVVIDYSALAGNAQLTTPTTTPGGSYSFNFQNGGDQPAGQATGTATFNDGTNSGQGDPLVSSRLP